MEPYIGVILYIIFFFWEILLLARYLKLIGTKVYRPNLKVNNQDELQMKYLPEEIVHMLSIEKANYFSESMAKVNSVILLKLFQKNTLKTRIEEDDRVKSLEISQEKNLPMVEQEVLNLFQEAEKKKQTEKPFSLRQIKWKVFGYQKVREVSNCINKQMKAKLKEEKLLSKTAFEKIELISKEIFLNFVLLFVIYGVTYLSFIPTLVGMLLASLFTICNMIFGFWAKKRISRYTKAGVEELTKIKMFGEALLDSIKEAEGEIKFQICEEYYPFAYAIRNSKRIYARS